jgi:hypothetical protein
MWNAFERMVRGKTMPVLVELGRVDPGPESARLRPHDEWLRVCEESLPDPQPSSERVIHHVLETALSRARNLLESPGQVIVEDEGGAHAGTMMLTSSDVNA